MWAFIGRHNIYCQSVWVMDYISEVVAIQACEDPRPSCMILSLSESTKTFVPVDCAGILCIGFGKRHSAVSPVSFEYEATAACMIQQRFAINSV